MSNNSPKDVELDLRQFLSQLSQQLQGICDKLEPHIKTNQDLKTIKDNVDKLKHDVDNKIQKFNPKGKRSGRDKNWWNSIINR
ncbi:hypothetical protein WA1_44200 [Scytonema hofmannii PCC 7110]|uniref:Uncharacterized protein n=1 Tax=Scytonema hofmannii PCC 7110 TaxID=128403 RepID=A0A139WW71_9CYAN|nr:hypothetical protein [Scytonema hofmannii]KYC36687.1 hypothetical protein WA1_44200 [Scytonema hofmannii PCC 7110]